MYKQFDSLRTLQKLFFLSSVSAVALFSCSTSLVSYSPKLSSDVSEGIRYYLPMDVIEISSKRIARSSRTVKFNPKGIIQIGNDHENCFSFRTESNISISVDPIEAITVNDPSHYYRVSIDPQWLSSGEVVLKRSSSGILREISISDDGRLDETALSTVQAVATIAGAASGLQSPLDARRVSSYRFDSGANEPLRNQEDNDSQPRTCSKWLLDLSKKMESVQSDLPAGDVKKAWDRAVADLATRAFTDEELLVLFVREQVVEFLRRAAYLNRYLEIKREKVDEIEGKLADSTANNRGELLTNKRLVESDIRLKTQELSSISSAIATAENKVISENGIGTRSRTTNIERIFNIDELPTPSDFKNWKSSGSQCIDPRYSWADSFCALEAGLTLGRASNEALVLDSTKSFTGNDEPRYEKESAYIFYRDSVPYLFKLYIQEYAGPNKLGFEESQSGVASLFSSENAPSAIKFESSITSERGLELAFSDKGMLTDVKYTYNSEGEAAAGALNSGANSALSSYSSGLSQAQGINAARASIEKDRVNQSAELLKAQKDQLDARIQLSGLGASANDIVLSEQLGQQIATLESQGKYLEAQLSSINQREAAISSLQELGLVSPSTSSASRAIGIDSPLLDLRIQEIELELELVRLRQERQLQQALPN